MGEFLDSVVIEGRRYSNADADDFGEDFIAHPSSKLTPDPGDAFNDVLTFLTADELLHAASSNTLAEGLKAETEGLHAIFSTADALEGLAKAGRARPTFKGE